MRTVNIGSVCFGEGRPKIIVPLVEEEREGIEKVVPSLLDSPADMIEWRIDFFNKNSSMEEIKAVAEMIKGKPLLITYRTKREGGRGGLSAEEYRALLGRIIDAGVADAVDIELSIGDEIVSDLINRANQAKIVTVVSSHDFEKTPSKNEMTDRLNEMKKIGCDIAKIAVMPRTESDVISLMEVTKTLRENDDMPPMITMSMGNLGMVSRVFGASFGSCATFGSVGKTSAPGQLEIGLLSYVLHLE